MGISNAEIAKILRGVAAAYAIKKIGNVFQIRAYENAADSVEHSTAEIFDLWKEGELSKIPALGEKIQAYLGELFTKGEVKHFKELQTGISPVVFDLLGISGIGPKTAQKLGELGVKDLEDLKKKIKSGDLVTKGFSAKIAQNIISSIRNMNQKDKRMLLPYAWVQAGKVLEYLKKHPEVIDVHPLGSLRRMVATVGDLDFSVSSKNGKDVVEYFCSMPAVARVIEKGENSATVLLYSGIHVDLLVGQPQAYGALLQHFTGSKGHNIKLRTIANQKGYSLSEYGVKRVKSSELRVQSEETIQCSTEEELYGLLGMQTPPPEIREDTGEIEAALKHRLPPLISSADIKGDIHIHTNYPNENPSHGPGVHSIDEMVKKAISLGYEFIGISDHPPALGTVSKENIDIWVQKRTKFIQNTNLKMSKSFLSIKSIRVLNGLEIDILRDGSLSVSDEALASLDYCIAGIHSGHHDSKEKITKRLLKAMENPYVDIISHPTNRLLNERESSEADWDVIFQYAARNKKILEISAFPNRLDLRDDLVKRALGYGVKFVINTDSHQLSQMDNMRFGVGVARRGWVTKESVVNTWDWKKLTKWFNIKS